MNKNYNLIKEQLGIIRLLENKNSLMLDNNIELIYSGSLNDRTELLKIMEQLSDVLQGRVSDILLTAHSDWFNISFKVNMSGQYVEILMDSKSGEVKMFLDGGEVVHVTNDLLNLLSGLKRFFNDAVIVSIRKIIN